MNGAARGLPCRDERGMQITVWACGVLVSCVRANARVIQLVRHQMRTWVCIGPARTVFSDWRLLVLGFGFGLGGWW